MWQPTSRGRVPNSGPDPGFELLKATLNVISMAFGRKLLKDLMHLAVCAPQHPLHIHSCAVKYRGSFCGFTAQP